MLSHAVASPGSTPPPFPIALATDIVAFPEWFTLRGHSGVFRIDKVRSYRDGLIVLANVNGREVGQCSVGELGDNICEAAR